MLSRAPVRFFRARRPCSFFSTHTAPTEIYTLSLHDALPICAVRAERLQESRQRPTAAGLAHAPAELGIARDADDCVRERLGLAGLAEHPPRTVSHGLAEPLADAIVRVARSEEHTSQLQSRVE